MKLTDKLIEAFGELLYVVAMADGRIQAEELKVVEEKLSSHKWGNEIKWSFDYEVKKNRPLDELYKKVITYCEMHGPEKEYQFLLDLVEDVAKASNGVDEKEQTQMDNFVNDLRRKFKEDIYRINNTDS